MSPDAPEAQSKYKDQLRIYTNANTYYYAINNKLPPFNNMLQRIKKTPIDGK